MKDKVESTKDIIQSAVVVVSLVHTLMESFGSASDLFHKLKAKGKKLEHSLEDIAEDRRKPLRRRRRDSDSDNSCDERGKRKRRKSRRKSEADSDGEEEIIRISRDSVRQEYDRGFRSLGERYAVGDLLAQNQLQAQIIALQQTLLNVFQQTDQIYGPQQVPSTHHLALLLDSARAARSNAVDALAKQYQRMREIDVISRMPQLSESTELAIHRNTKAEEKKEDTPKPRYSSKSLFCVYSLDLHHRPSDPLADVYKPGGNNACPYCRHRILTTHGKAWKITKPHMRRTRDFLIENRFVVKCHREGGGFACMLCWKFRESDTTCGKLEDLVDHIWRDHEYEEYEKEEDIMEVTRRA